MKKLILSLLAIAAMTSCTKSSEEEVDPNAPVEIKLSAGVLEAQARSAIETNAITGISILRKDGTDNKTDWGTSVKTIKIEDASSNIFDTEKEYYDPNTSIHAYFMGYYPAGTISGNGVDQIITFYPVLSDCSTDILYSSEVDLGTKETPTANAKLTFKHKLARINFVFVQGEGYPTGDYIKSIKIKSIGLPKTMKLSDGSLTFDAAVADGIEVLKNTDDTKFTIIPAGTSTTATDAAMIQPEQIIKLDITTNKGTFSDIEVKVGGNSINTTDNKIEAGKQYTITITFSGKAASTTGTVEAWGNSITGSSNAE